VAFHAHPDDESLLTGGVLARCAVEGHRVVLVVATDGARGLATVTDGLAVRRAAEVERAAAVLGVSRIVLLGYPDSGYTEPARPAPGTFCTIPVDQVAERLASVLMEEQPDVLTVYDDNGGYGHRDHIHVHRVGVAAAAMAGTPRVLAATADRQQVLRAVRLLHRVHVRPGGATPERLAESFTDSADITHEIDVRPWVGVKQAALRTHASQATGGADLRTVRLLSRLPRPIASRVLGREWFVEVGAPRPSVRLHDLFLPVVEPLGSPG
jgi:LmbE family N-acetylglucosaminyl deacetylase